MNFKKIRNYLGSLKKKGIDTGLSSLCYFSTSPITLGHHFFIKKFINSNYKLQFYFFYLKQIFSIDSAFNIKIKKNKNVYYKKKIYITWGFQKDFDKFGNIIDQYYKISSKDNSVLWVVLYIDKKIPKKISNNIILIYNLYSQKRNNIFLSVFYLIKILFNEKFDLKKIFHKASYPSLLAENIFKKICNFINHETIEKIFTPYEGQPFQHHIPYQFKKLNKKIKSYGYVSHNLPHSFDMFFREGSPDTLFLQSPDHIKYFYKYLGWDKKKLIAIKSLRFRKTKKEVLSNKVYFSNQLYNIESLANNFENFLSICQDRSLPKLKICTHPRSYDFLKQNNLKNIFETIIKKNKKKFDHKTKKRISVVVGLTSTPVFLLAHKIKVIHIVNDSFFHGYSSEFWPSISTKKINNFVYEYSLKRNRDLLNIKKNRSNLLLKNLKN